MVLRLATERDQVQQIGEVLELELHRLIGIVFLVGSVQQQQRFAYQGTLGNTCLHQVLQLGEVRFVVEDDCQLFLQFLVNHCHLLGGSLLAVVEIHQDKFQP
jgi:hypothetical protein